MQNVIELISGAAAAEGIGAKPDKTKNAIDKLHQLVSWYVLWGLLTYPTVQFVGEVDALLDAAVAAATSLRKS